MTHVTGNFAPATMSSLTALVNTTGLTITGAGGTSAGYASWDTATKADCTTVTGRGCTVTRNA